MGGGGSKTTQPSAQKYGRPWSEEISSDVLRYLRSATALMDCHSQELLKNAAFKKQFTAILMELQPHSDSCDCHCENTIANININESNYGSNPGSVGEITERKVTYEEISLDEATMKRGGKAKRRKQPQKGLRPKRSGRKIKSAGNMGLESEDSSGTDGSDNGSVVSSVIGMIYKAQRAGSTQNMRPAGKSGGSIDDLLRAAAEITTNSVSTVEHISVAVTRKVCWLLNAERATLWIKSGKKMYCCLDKETMCTNKLNTQINSKKIKVTQDITHHTAEGYSITNNDTIIMDTAGCHNAADISVHHQDIGIDIKSSMWIPITHEGEVYACINVSNKLEFDEVIDFTDEDESLLGSLNMFVATVLSNAMLYADLNDSYKSSEVLLSLVRTLAGTELQFQKLCDTIMNSAKKLLSADRCSLFVVDKNANQLSARFEGHSQEVRLPLTAGIAGHVATTSETCNITNAYSDPRFNAETDRQTGYKTESILCVPIKSGDQVVAVAQLVNKHLEDGPVAFTNDDENTFAGFSQFAGINIKNTLLHEQMIREKRTVTAILSTVKELNKIDIMQTDVICSKIMEHAKDLVKCERCALFMVDKEHNQLFSTVANQSGEIRFPVTQGIAGHVARTAEIQNISNAYADRRFNTDIDKKTGYITKNILAMPVMFNNEVIAVTQLVNKLGDESFSSNDEETLSVFSEFAAMSLRNANLFQFMKQAEEESKTLLDIESSHTKSGRKRRGSVFVVHQMDFLLQRCQGVTLTTEESQTLLTCRFNTHRYNIHHSDNHHRLVACVVQIFIELGFVEEFNIPESALWLFIIAIQSKYRHVPYHNFTHAFDVTQTLSTWMADGKLDNYLSRLNQFSLLIAGLCHDLDHMGLNNSFLLKVETPLGVLSASSGSTSVLEVHHCNVAIDILQNEDYNILSGCSPEQTKEIWKCLIETILATDMANHQGICEKFRTTDFQFDDPSHRKLTMCMLLKCADISNITKPFEISRTWGQYVTAEFYWQGDQEREANLDVTPLFDRQNANELAAGQLGFIEGLGLPLFRLITRLVPMESVLDQLITNRNTWEEILQKQHKPKQPSE